MRPAACRRLKLGTTLVLPGRNPVRLAKELATLDRCRGAGCSSPWFSACAGRAELAAMGVGAEKRGALMDEALPLLRRLWSEDDVDHHGPTWNFEGVSVEPKPLQTPLEMWLGGSIPSALRRTGTLADGWLPSLCTPAEAAAGQVVIEGAAAAAGRTIDPEHFGVSIGYLPASHDGPPPRELAARLARRSSPVEVDEVMPSGHDALRRLLERFVDVGFSKFVVRPIVPPPLWEAELDELASKVLVHTDLTFAAASLSAVACFASIRTDEGGAVATARAEITISKPADEVWAIVGDFGGLASWMPGIESCVVDDFDRILKMSGLEDHRAARAS